MSSAPPPSGGPVDRVDVLIVTAARGEDDAVRDMADDGAGTWQETNGPEGYKFPVWMREFATEHGRPMRVAVTRAHDMRGEAAATAAAPLVAAYRPQCLAMCGVCAGRPDWTNLGDVIIADSVYRYDAGERVVEPGSGSGVASFKAETRTYQLNARWRQDAERFKVPDTAPWLEGRPRPREHQADWVLAELHAKRDPMAADDCEVMCKDWDEVVGDLWERGLLVGSDLKLTAEGRKHIKSVLIRGKGKLPEQPPFAVHVGPLATGNDLQRDPGIFDRLAVINRLVCGLDMEGSAIGMAAHVHEVPRMIVTKGVMDFADPDRNYGFRPFAARAAAEVLIGFLRKHFVPPDPSRTAADVLTHNVWELREGLSPGGLLNPRHQAVPFLDAPREGELDELAAWCVDPAATGVRLCLGAGGPGKTRLLIEWAKRRRADEWVAGFLPDQSEPADAETLLASDRPTLVVIDYAETRPTLIDLLRRVANRPADQTAPLRVALLARDVGDWWTTLFEQDADVQDLLSQHEPRRLEPVPLEGPLRREVFAAAYRAFADLRGKDAAAPDVDLSDDRYGRVLYLHMAALASVDGIDFTAETLLHDVVVHEKRFWTHRYKEEHAKDVLDAAAFRKGASRTVAGVTLRGGVETKEQADALNGRVDGPGEKHFVRYLHGLYPGHGEGGERRYLGGLEPDLLGESLVAGVLSDDETPEDYLERVFEGAAAPTVANGFVVLGRISVRHDVDVEPWMRRLLAADVPGRAEAAFDAAMALGKESAHAPLGRILGDALEREGTLEHAVAFDRAVPDETVSLREVAAWATGRCLQMLPTDSDEEEVLSERGRLLNNLGKRLSDLGRREDALDATKEAVGVYGRLTDARPDAFLHYLAMSLNNLGIWLSELGRREDALDATQEAVEIRRRLAEERPDAFLPDLATSLSNLGMMLSNLGRREDALAATQEAVDVHRRLARKRPNAFMPGLAMSLNNLGNQLSELGRREDALAATQEGVDIRRRLAEERPDAFLPDLAMSLNNLGIWLSALGRREDALAVTQEGVGIRRRLAQERPDAFLPDLAASLNNLGSDLSDLGRREDALDATQEAVDLYRHLAQERPDAFLPDLASSLNNLGIRLSELGRREDALDATQEAVQIRRRLAEARPDASLPNLAMSLNNLGVLLSELGRLEDALAPAREAVDVYRRLAEERPDAFMPDLAISLNNLGIRLSELDRREDGLVATQEAVDLYRRLAEASPDAFMHYLATSLNNLGMMLRNLGRREDALAAAQEAVQIYADLVERHPTAFERDFLVSYRNLLMRLDESGQSPQSDPTVRRGMAVMQKHGLTP